MSVEGLDTKVQYIKGVGEQRAKAFEKLGVTTLRDLVMNYPRAYEDRRECRSISELQFGQMCCVSATVAAPARLSRIRTGLDITKAVVVDDAGRMTVTFFNQSYVGRNLIPGESYIFYGRVAGKLGAPEMVNPAFERESSPPGVTRRIVPIYRMTAGLSQGRIAAAVRAGLDACGDLLPEQLPRAVREKYKLAQTRFAYENIHFPRDLESLELARRRLIFQELFVLSCTLSFMRSRQMEKDGRVITPPDMGRFYAALPFTLTGAQSRAIDEILSDMSSGRPMSRLVQGDVGSGKTMVAAAAAYAVAMNGRQAAFMAPTEILAEQHYKSLGELLAPLGIRVGLLTAGMGAKARRETQEQLRSGEIGLVIGTHALISQSVEFSDLALIIADEQHRFGVQQRAALTDKGDTPHVLVMSATPIPRTLALIVYGDLDVSVINELPPGRQKVDTFLVGEKNEVMGSFAAGDIDILVATTVIEVGVDVPNAALMVVENADRFGLSQLHQLRGRVGRGQHKSYCVLFEGAGGDTATQRLRALCRTNDGFKLAEADLAMRGPGDFFGSRQSGLPDMQIASFISDMEMLKTAQTAATELLAADPELSLPENAVLRESVDRLLEKNKGTMN